MPRFPAYLRHRLAHHDKANVDHATRNAHLVDDQTVYRTTAGGDEHKLRGIPAIGRGVTGAINGTRPQDAIR